MANEENDLYPFMDELIVVLDYMKSGHVYLVIDEVSTDNTLKLCRELSGRDSRFDVLWAPENRNIVDAYLRGYREALKKGHEIIIEMDAGLSHDPRALPMFLRVLNEGNDCAFGSRFINGGSMVDSPFKRRLLSWGGTFLANFLLGTRMCDMTSGFQGFHASIVKAFIDFPFQSKAHFYQTELRYLLRRTKYMEVPIHYKAPSPRVSSHAISNSFSTLFHYALKRCLFQSVEIEGRK